MRIEHIFVIWNCISIQDEVSHELNKFRLTTSIVDNPKTCQGDSNEYPPRIPGSCKENTNFVD